MASSLYKAQDALKMCAEHEHKDLSCYCKTCQKFICSSCAKTTHHGHDWDLIASVAKERRIGTPNLCRGIKNKNLPKCQEKLVELAKAVENNDLEYKRQLAERRLMMIGMINRIIDEQHKLVGNEKSMLDAERRDLEKKINFLEKVTSSLENNIATLSDFDVIEMEKEMLKVLGEIESYDANRATSSVTFLLGNINEGLIKEMIGGIEGRSTTVSYDSNSDAEKTSRDVIHESENDAELNASSDVCLESLSISEMKTPHNDTDASVSVAEVKNFKNFDQVITTVVSSSKSEAWIGAFGNSEIKQLSVENNGTKRNPLKFWNDFIRLESGDFIVTYREEQEIRRMTSSGKVSYVLSTKPLHPTRISKAQKDEVLVTLRDNGDRFKLEPSSRRLVQRMTLTGDVLQTYEFREDGVTRLFIWPFTTAENGNSDVCITNRTSSDTGELIVLKGNGKPRFTYRAQEGRIFHPRDVACDRKKRIIVTDNTNKSLHLLSPDGTFLRFLLSDLRNIPFSMALYQDSLWIGFNDGSVKVYKYIE